MNQMDLGTLIGTLEQIKPDTMWVGGDSVDSYRGYYDQLAIEPGGEITVGEMRARLRLAVGATMTGYKGGDYLMRLDTPVWSSPYGEASGLAVVGVVIRGGKADLVTAEQGW